MPLIPAPLWDALRDAWLLLLTAGWAACTWRLGRLEREQHAHEHILAAIRQDLGALRADLRDVARSRQIDDLRRALVADLRPLVADAVDLRLAGWPGRVPAPPTTVGSIITSGGAAAAGGHVVDERTEG
jgi:hypothetical protein